MKPVVINSPDQNKERKRLDKSNVFEEFKLDAEYKSIGKDKLYYLYTYGCQGNESDSEKIRGLMEEMSFSITYDLDKTDVIIMNTCAIRKNAEDKVFGEIGRLKQLKRKKPELIIGLCGCMAQEESVVRRLLTRYQNVDFIFGTHNIHSLPALIKRVMENKERIVDVLSYEGDIVEEIPIVRESNIKAWVPIMYGCDEFCTYCIVPYTRGKERSRAKEDIINEVTELVKEGYIEVTLLGQNVNAYGKDLGNGDYTFGDLLFDIDKTGIQRVRFTSPHPRDMDDRAIEAMAKCKSVMPHLHFPVQSGNDRVLKIMNRKYTREIYLEKIKKLKELVPGISITTDIIVGYPGETYEEFKDTVSLVEEAEFEGAFTFIFSPREGTPAYSMEDPISLEDKHKWFDELVSHTNQGYLNGHEKFIGKTVKVLVDGESKSGDGMLCGYSEHNKLTHFKSNDLSLVGKIVNVRVTEAKTWFMIGELCE